MKSISLVSTRSYLGSIGSGSVSGYYTIWTARIDAHGFITGQPQPRKINQNLIDLARFRGQLWQIVDGSYVVQVEARECSECGEISLITEGLERCNICQAKDAFGLL